MHADLVATYRRGWRGALLIGPSGAGKSDLALRCVDSGWRMVADDRVILWAAAGRLFGRAPQVLHGLIELRGQGMAALPALAFAEVACLVRLQPPSERLPEALGEVLEGVRLPVFHLEALQPSAPARLRRIVDGL